MATGRSDFPNQVNNVLGFPFIFRGALDVRATGINEEMKVAAVHAIANLAREDVPDSVLRAYGVDRMGYGRNYIIPKPLDDRVLFWVAPAVAQAAIDSGVSRIDIEIDTYRDSLEARLGRSREIMRGVVNKARTSPRRIVFPEGDHEKILRACQILMDEGIARPVVLGSQEKIRETIEALNLDLPGIAVEDPAKSTKREWYIEELLRLRHRKGMTQKDAEVLISDRSFYGAMMVHVGDVEGLVSGVSQSYPETIRPALQVIGIRDDIQRVSGLYIMVVRSKVYFFADATVNIDPTPEALAEMAIESARVARTFDIEPRVAMLSFSNFGSSRHPVVERVQKAVEILKHREPELKVDGEMQADTAVNPEIAADRFPFSAIQGDANVLIFPDLQSGNVAYKLLRELGGAEAIGPILMGMRKPVHVLQHGCDVSSIVNVTAIAVLDAQAQQA